MCVFRGADLGEILRQKVREGGEGGGGGAGGVKKYCILGNKEHSRKEYE